MFEWQPIIKMDSFTNEMKETFDWVVFAVRGDWNTDTVDQVEICKYVPTVNNWRTSNRQAPRFVPTHFMVIGKLP